MIKLSVNSSNEVFVKMSKVEFEGLSRKDLAQTADGATVSLGWLAKIVNAGSGLLEAAKNAADTLSSALEDILA